MTVTARVSPLGALAETIRLRWPYDLAVAATAAGACTVGLLAVRVGFALTAFLLVFVAGVLIAATKPRVLALLLLALMPLPSVDAVTRVPTPAGLNPVQILVVLAVGIAVYRAVRFPLRGAAAVTSCVALNVGLLAIAWYRTYGYGAIGTSSLSLFIEPTFLFLGGVVTVALLPPRRVEETIGLAIATMLGVVGVSVILQRLGVYHPPVDEDIVNVGFGAKDGGVMLQGNEAGALFSIFAVPAYVLLASAGRRRVGIALLAFSFPVLLLTGSRTSLLIFPVALVALAVIQRRLENARAALIVLGFAALWGATIGRPEVRSLARSLTQSSATSNSTLSGRPAIWHQALVYLDGGSHWTIGGGLNAFERFAPLTPLQTAFTTHDTALWLLTTGGIVLVGAYVLLVLALWWFGRGVGGPPGVAIRLALIGILLEGISKDVGLFDRGTAWLWSVVAVAGVARARRAVPRPWPAGGTEPGRP